jgi:FAD:protein FMN transferase
MKNCVFPVFICMLFAGCSQNKSIPLISIEGEAQGTTYHISYYSDSQADFKSSVDSIVRKIDSSLSTYLPVSIISRINRNEMIVTPDAHFITVFNKATEVSQKTNGAFDITVAPIINAYGFGFSKKEKVSQTLIDSLLALVGYRSVAIQNGQFIKENPATLVDFNAIAQGYTVDVIGQFLESKGVKNYYVELGGEVIAKGKKNNGEFWKIGIDKPNEDAAAPRDLESIVSLQNEALATSGNYRKFYVEDGQKYAHIIDPSTGYPAKNNLLSVSVIANDCMTADAYATAFMVMGVEKSKQFLLDNRELGLEVFFIYDEQGNWKTFASDKIKQRVEMQP